MIKRLIGLYDVLSTIDEKDFSVYNVYDKYYVYLHTGSFPISKKLYDIFSKYKYFALSDVMEHIMKERNNKLKKVL